MIIPYLVWLTTDDGTGDRWKVWLGTAPSEKVSWQYAKGLCDVLNEFEKSSIHPKKWEIQTVEGIDLATALAGGQVEVASWYYRHKDNPSKVTILPARVEDSVSFMHQPDINPESPIDDTDSICPECDSQDVIQTGSLDMPDGPSTILNPLICNNCHTAWDDIYERVGITNVEPSEADEGNSSDDITKLSWETFCSENGLDWLMGIVDDYTN